MIKKKYAAPSCDIIECGTLSVIAGSKGSITINKDPYEGELNSKTGNSWLWDDDRPDNSSLWE